MNDHSSLHKPVATVASSETREDDKRYTVYKVVVTDGKNSYFIFRRYNEFYSLYEKIRKYYPDFSFKFPPKKIFGDNFNPDFIKKRQEKLNEFILLITSETRLHANPDIRDFMGLNKKKLSGIGSEDELLEPHNHNAADDVELGPSADPKAKPGDFEFLRVIGRGSFGKVLLARHRNDNVYAVKVLEKAAIKKRNEIKHIMSERNVLLKNVKHPFLIGLHFSFQTRDKLYFVLDYVNGGELFFHLQRQRCFSESRAMFYSAEMASAIGYLHSEGIIYRDLKPENILLDAEGHVVLTDFGLCKEGIAADETTGTFCGTPEYLAPEVLRREPYSKAVDWWCLGAVLYEMLYGLPPFYSRDHQEMYRNIMYSELSLKHGVSASGQDALRRLLEKDKNARLGSMHDLDEVSSHAFYSSIDWDDLYHKKVTPPWRPNVTNAYDLRHIDPEFVREPIPQSLGISASVHSPDQAFEGFTYVPPGAMDD